MLKDLIKKYKKDMLIEKNEGKNEKKKLENLVVLIVLIIIVIVVINNMWGKSEDKTEKSNSISNKQLAQVNAEYPSEVDLTVLNTQEQLKNNLENILSQINGVGKVNVLITYSESSEIIPMYNETIKQNKNEESDSSGGTRKEEDSDITKNIIYDETAGKPITQKVVSPKIEGVIAIAEGATNLEVKSKIIQAIEAATGVATYKIQVFEMNNNI